MIRNIIPTIPSHEMKDGEVGIITQWGGWKDYKGIKVIREGRELKGVDRTDYNWGIWFDCGLMLSDCRVQIVRD